VYFNNEPLDYQDDVVGANITDIMAEIENAGIEKYIMLTHGSKARSIDENKNILSNMPKKGRVGIDFHIYESGEITSYIFDKINKKRPDKSIEKRRKEIIRGKVQRFVHFIDGLIRSGRPFYIKIIETTEEDINRFPKGSVAYKFLSEMRSLEKEMSGEIEKYIKKMNQTRQGGKILIRKTPILWAGDAARFLMDKLGVDPEEVKKIYMSYDWNRLDMSYGNMLVDRDGTLNMYLRRHAKPMRLSEMFPDHRSGRFRTFTEFLRFMYLDIKKDEIFEFRPMSIPISEALSWFGPIVYDTMESIIKLNGIKSLENAHSIVISYAMRQLFAMIIALRIMGSDLENILSKPDAMNEKDDELIYKALKDLMIPNILYFNIAKTDLESGKEKLYTGTYALNGEESVFSEEEIFHDYILQKIPQNAFAPVSARIQNAGKVKLPSKTSTLQDQLNYIGANKPLFSNVLGEGTANVLLRVPVEAVEPLGQGNIRNILAAFQDAPNGYVEMYYMSGIGEVGSDVYKKLGLTKKELPENFRYSRENTVTLFPAFKGKDEDAVSVAMKLGSFEINSTNTILSPIGLQNDTAGLSRSVIIGLKLMMIARQIKREDNILNDQKFIDKEVQLGILEQLKGVCGIEAMKASDIKPEDIVILLTGSSDKIIEPLNKLIKLLPITPYDDKELRDIYEHMKDVITAA